MIEDPTDDGYDESLQRSLALRDRMRDCYGMAIGQGRNRTVFRASESEVVKIPNDCYGERANQREYDEFVNNRRLAKENLAAVRIETDPLTGFTLLYQEYLPTTYFAEYKITSEFPDWVKSVECHQVGYTRDGRLVAYDYAE